MKNEFERGYIMNRERELVLVKAKCYLMSQLCVVRDICNNLYEDVKNKEIEEIRKIDIDFPLVDKGYALDLSRKFKDLIASLFLPISDESLAENIYGDKTGVSEEEDNAKSCKEQ